MLICINNVVQIMYVMSYELCLIVEDNLNAKKKSRRDTLFYGKTSS